MQERIPRLHYGEALVSFCGAGRQGEHSPKQLAGSSQTAPLLIHPDHVVEVGGLVFWLQRYAPLPQFEGIIDSSEIVGSQS